MDSRNRVEAYASGFTTLMGIFLALIGVFPSGTKPHVFISTWFFIQGDLAILTWGAGLLARGWRRIAIFLLTLAVASPLIGFGVDWPSAAVAEAFGIVVLDIWVFTMLKVHGLI